MRFQVICLIILIHSIYILIHIKLADEVQCWKAHIKSRNVIDSLADRRAASTKYRLIAPPEGQMWAAHRVGDGHCGRT